MLSNDHLDELCRRLEASKQPGGLRDDIVAYLEAIYHHEDYQSWLSEKQYFSPSNPNALFTVPYDVLPEIDEEDRQFRAKRVLDAFSIIENGVLQVKVDRLSNGVIHLTDAPWVHSSLRVFSFKDESDLLAASADKDVKNADILIDPACGCGHHSMNNPSIPVRISMDISFRALVYARLNSILCGHPHQLSSINDVFNGFPEFINIASYGNVLILVNMPFAIFPMIEGSAAPAQDGGNDGADLSRAALRAIHQFMKSENRVTKSVAHILVYTLGEIGEGTERWQLVDFSKEIFGESCVEYFPLSDEMLWRVNGKKEQPNPMPVDAIALKSECRHTYPDELSRERARKGYESLIADFKRRGFSHLGYGVIRIENIPADQST